MCKELRNGTTPSFRGYKEAADKKWSMKERVRNGSDEKREEALPKFGAEAKEDCELAEVEGAGRSLHLGRGGGHLPV